MSKYLFSLNKIRFVVYPIYYSQKSKATRILAFSENLFNLLKLGTLLCVVKKNTTEGTLSKPHSKSPTFADQRKEMPVNIGTIQRVFF
jgi:hypothetical protein